MANLDTLAKRYSGIHVSSPWRGGVTKPTGTVERQQPSYFYSGVTAGAPAVSTGRRGGGGFGRMGVGFGGLGVRPSSLPFSASYLDLIWYGQSNLLNHFGTASSPPAALEGTQVWDNSGSAWASPPSANGIREALNRIKILTGRSVRAVYGGHSGVPIALLQKGAGTNYYEDLYSRIVASGIAPSFIIWHQGEGDANVPSSTARVYKSDLDTLHGTLVTDLGKTRAQIPMIVSGLATVNEASFTAPDSVWWDIQRALIAAPDSYPNIHYSHSNLDAVLSDGVHWTGASYGRSGKRYAQMVAKLLGNVSTDAAWLISGATIVDATHTDISVTHDMGSDFTPTSGISGFDISSTNFATTSTITAAVRQGATTIRLTHGDLGVLADRQIRYQYGKLPDVSAPVVDDGAINAALVHTANQNISATGSGSYPVFIFNERQAATRNSGVFNKYTATGFSLGTRSEEVMVACGVSLADGSFALSSARLIRSGQSDIAATVVQTGTRTGSGSHIISFILPAGSDSFDIEVTFAGDVFAQPNISVDYVATSKLSSTTKVSSGTANGSSTGGSVDISTSTGGIILAAAVCAVTTGSNSISGDESFANNYDLTVNGGKHVGGTACNISAAVGVNTVTATFGTSGAWVLTTASWR